MSEPNKSNTPNSEANREEERKERKREYMREYMRRKRQEQRKKEEEGKEEKEDLGEALAQNKPEKEKKGGWKDYLIIAIIAGIILLMPFLQNYIQPIIAKLNLKKNNGGAWE